MGLDEAQKKAGCSKRSHKPVVGQVDRVYMDPHEPDRLVVSVTDGRH